MSFLELAKRRYSVRAYKPDAVEKEKVDLILEAAKIAPTGANYQPFHLIIIKEKEGLEKLKKAANVYDAPMAVIVCGDKSKAWKRSYDGKIISDIDSTIVTDHMMLQATDLGLGTLWVCHFKPDIIVKEFGLPDHLEPVNILAIGYPNDIPKSPDRHSSERKNICDLISYEKY